MIMGTPRWRQIAKTNVPEMPKAQGKPQAPWTLLLDFVPSGKLLRVTAKGNWTPEGATGPCGPDGDFADPATGLPLPRAARGALIGRIGGGTADLTSDDKMLVFAVGRMTIVQLPDDKKGALLLGVNDKAQAASNLEGQLEVTIEEAL
jgi:hypothetical protein